MEKLYEQGYSVGTEKPRAYFIPFQAGQARSERREDSKLFQSLNGDWDFCAYESVLDAENFLHDAPQAKIPVPSCVQFYGYDRFQYTNDRYPFMLHAANEGHAAVSVL